MLALLLANSSGRIGQWMASVFGLLVYLSAHGRRGKMSPLCMLILRAGCLSAMTKPQKTSGVSEDSPDT